MSEALPLGVAAVFPCSSNQRHFLAIDRLGAGRTALNYAFRYQIDGPLRLPVLQQAFERLLARHEILRTRFAIGGPAVQQEVMVSVAGPVPLIDLSHLGKDAAEIEAMELGRRDAAKPFDLTRPPLVRLTALQLDPLRHILLITAHATIMDGWSIGVLVTELGRLIAAIDRDQEPDLSTVDLHFGDFARWQQSVGASGGFEEDLSYWKTELRGLREFRLPGSNPVPADRQFLSFTRGVILNRTETDRAVAFARDRGCTFFNLALAALTAMLHERTGFTEIVLGTQISGRAESDAESIVGPVLNSVVLRMRLTGNHSGSALLESAQRVSTEALSHQSVPFATVVGAVAPERSLARNPLYAINFALQAAFIHEDTVELRDNGAFAIHSLPSASHSALWDLNFGLVERPDGWRMSCEADGDLYTVATIDDLLNVWASCLNNIVDRPEEIISHPAPVGSGAAAQYNREAKHSEESHPDSFVHTIVQKANNRSARVARLAVSRPDFVDDRITVYQPQAPGLPVMALNVTSLLYPLATFDPNRAFYDIQLASDVAPSCFEPRALGDLAVDAVRLIRRARPKGPYVILAYCVVGAVALEAARQLRNEGEDVSLVSLVDTWRPGYREDLTRFEKRLRRISYLWNQYKLDRDRVKIGTMTRVEAIRLHMSAPVRRWLRLQAKADALNRNVPHPSDWYINYIHHAYRYHRPAPYEGRVALFAATKVCRGRLFPRDFGWSEHVKGGLDYFEVPGEHEEILNEPAVSVLGAHLQTAIARVEADARKNRQTTKL